MASYKFNNTRSPHYDVVDPDYDHLIKMVVIGDSGVGKSSLIKRFAKKEFLNTHLTTIGVDFEVRTIPVDNQVAKLQIWDTAGQERFRSIITSYYKGADAIMVVWDVSDRDSFDHIEHWVSEIRTYARPHAPILLVGNKNDLVSTVVPSEIDALASSLNLNAFFTSAKTDFAVTNAFEELARNYVSAHRDGLFDDPTSANVNRPTVTPGQGQNLLSRGSLVLNCCTIL